MANIAIVTDTSSDLLPEQAQAAGIRLVPLTVSFGDETFEAITELTNEQFYEKLTAPGAPLPKTAAPNPAAFEVAYREALEAGADGVVCVTISEKLSATYSSAVQGAASLEQGQVEVIDSMTTTHALAMIVTLAAELARGSATQAEVVARVRESIEVAEKDIVMADRRDAERRELRIKGLRERAQSLETERNRPDPEPPDSGKAPS